MFCIRIFSLSLDLCGICFFRLVCEKKSYETGTFVFESSLLYYSTVPHFPNLPVLAFSRHLSPHVWGLLQRGTSIKSLTSHASLLDFKSKLYPFLVM